MVTEALAEPLRVALQAVQEEIEPRVYELAVPEPAAAAAAPEEAEAAAVVVPQKPAARRSSSSSWGYAEAVLGRAAHQLEAAQQHRLSAAPPQVHKQPSITTSRCRGSKYP